MKPASGSAEQHRNHVAQPVARGSEVDIEHGDQRLVRRGEALGQRAGLEARAILPVPVLDVEPLRAEGSRLARDHRDRFISRIVEHLNVQLVAGPIERDGGAHRADADLVLVEQRDLDQHLRQVRLRQEGARQVNAPVRRSHQIVELDADQGEKATADRNETDHRECEAALEKCEKGPDEQIEFRKR